MVDDDDVVVEDDEVGDDVVVDDDDVVVDDDAVDDDVGVEEPKEGYVSRCAIQVVPTERPHPSALSEVYVPEAKSAPGQAIVAAKLLVAVPVPFSVTARGELAQPAK